MTILPMRLLVAFFVIEWEGFAEGFAAFEDRLFQRKS